MQGRLTKIVISIFTSLLIAVCCYLRDNISLPVFDSFDAISLYENIWQQNSPGAINDRDSVLLINVAYDKAVADVALNSLDYGKVAITDRAKLLEFLQRAERADNYRLIFLDIHFDKDVTTPYDSALFHQILSMRDVWFSHHQGVTLPHDSLKARALMNDYYITLTNSDFSRYPFLQHDKESASLTIVSKLDPNHRTIKRHGPIYCYDGKLCTNSPFLPIRGGIVLQRDDGEAPDAYNLGNDLIEMPEEYVAEDLDGKLVIVGDFKNDTHNTYAGSQAGSYLVYLACKSLMEGKHIVNWWLELFLFVLHALLAYGILNGVTPESILKSIHELIDNYRCNRILKIRFKLFSWMRKCLTSDIFYFFINLFSYTLILYLLSLILYLEFGVVRLAFIPVLILSMLPKVESSLPKAILVWQTCKLLLIKYKTRLIKRSK